MQFWDSVTRCIRVKHGLPNDWVASSMSCNKDSVQPGWVKVCGGRYPLLTRGKRKGKPNWRKPLDKERVFFVPLAEINALPAAKGASHAD